MSRRDDYPRRLTAAQDAALDRTIEQDTHSCGPLLGKVVLRAALRRQAITPGADLRRRSAAHGWRTERRHGVLRERRRTASRGGAVHDDVIDDAGMRRGQPSVDAADGSVVALLTGDVLLGVALRRVAHCGRSAVDALTAALIDLAHGEALQHRHAFDPDLPLATALRIAQLKTGSLLSAACVLGAYCAGHPDHVVDALTHFGRDFGVALQLADDLLDVLGDANELGKPTGHDFAGGTVTVPAVLAIRKQPQLRMLLRPGLGHGARVEAVELLRCPSTVAATRQLAADHAERARRSLLCAAEPSLAAVAEWPAIFVQRMLSDIDRRADAIDG